MLSFPSIASQPLTSLAEDSVLTLTSNDKEASQRFEGGYLSGEGEDIDTSVPMLPSQLRRRHESLRRQRSASMQSRPSPSLANSTAVSYNRHSMITVESTINNNKNSRPSHTDFIMGSTLSSSPQIVASQGYSTEIVPLSQSNNGAVVSSTLVPGGPEMPTRDWVKMQCKIQALETEVSHVSRTNTLLNQELDKVTAHLSRLLNSETENDIHQGQGGQIAGGGGAGPVESWRREYEFLVQQVDLMHRQLQLAQSEQHARARFGMEVVPASRSKDHSEMTQQLYSEVRDLTASLKMWQTAFQQADEKYRRKCGTSFSLYILIIAFGSGLILMYLSLVDGLLIIHLIFIDSRCI
jgi:flagellar biosynthesis chaperone FliJ